MKPATTTRNRNRQAELGQFITAEPVPDFMASMFGPLHKNGFNALNVNNNAMRSPWLWSVPSTYPTGWNAPTSAYLFQRPRPYWKLRGDFHHLAPFIPGLWY